MYLLLVGEEEPIRVHAICDGIANHRDPVEDHRRLIGVLEQQLLQDIEDDGEQDKGGETGSDKDGKRRVRRKIGQWASESGEDTHTAQVQGNGRLQSGKMSQLSRGMFAPK